MTDTVVIGLKSLKLPQTLLFLGKGTILPKQKLKDTYACLQHILNKRCKTQII